MLKRILLPTILAILAYGFWLSPDFKEISAGVAIFLDGRFMFLTEPAFPTSLWVTLRKLEQIGRKANLTAQAARRRRSRDVEHQRIVLVGYTRHLACQGIQCHKKRAV